MLRDHEERSSFIHHVQLKQVHCHQLKQVHLHSLKQVHLHFSFLSRNELIEWMNEVNEWNWRVTNVEFIFIHMNRLFFDDHHSSTNSDWTKFIIIHWNKFVIINWNHLCKSSSWRTIIINSSTSFSISSSISIFMHLPKIWKMSKNGLFSHFLRFSCLY